MKTEKYRGQKSMWRIENALKEEGFRLIAGVDESGRGPLAGPVVAGAVILKKTSFSTVIKDSKLLTHKARVRAYEEIKKYAHVGVGIIDREKIDRLNILQASLLAMRNAVSRLKVKPDCLLIDGPYGISDNVKNVSVIGGDGKSFCIACASIVAKVTRDKIMHRMDKLYPQYDFKNNKGYGTKKHFQLIEQFGPSPIHRLSFFPFMPKENKRKCFAEGKKEILA